MRVLMLTELYPPFIGGSEQHVRNLARGLVARGHDIAVATVARGSEATSGDEDGVRVHRVRSTTQRAAALSPSGRPYLPPLPDPDVVAALRTIIAAERPDVVHAHNWMVHSFVPLKRGSAARLVMTLHDYSIVCAKRSLLYRGRTCSGPGVSKCLRCAARNYGPARGAGITLSNWAMAPLLRRAVDLFVPVSRAVASGNRLAEQELPFEVIPNFVPDDIADAPSGPTHLPAGLPDRPFWLYVGALTRHKGVHVLLDAYARVAGAPPLVLLGRLDDDAPPALPDNVTLLTDVAHGAVMAAWRAASLGIVPSLFPDPCPTVALEAMAAGVPLVASDTGGLPDIVADGETGLLVRPGDASALATALARMRDAGTERERMAQAALRRAPAFMATRVVGRVESLYARLVA